MKPPALLIVAPELQLCCDAAAIFPGFVLVIDFEQP
jgi:hypothetical protein